MDDIFTIAKTGVAVGGASTGAEDAPLFEADIETKFKKSVDMSNVELDSTIEDWTKLDIVTTASLGKHVATEVDRGRSGLNYYVFGDGHVKLEGTISIANVDSSWIIIENPIPEEYRPIYPIYFVGTGRTDKYSSTYRYYPHQLIFGYVGIDGNVYVRKSCTFGSDSVATGNNSTWCDIRAQWWV